jgi:hypothetical protein
MLAEQVAVERIARHHGDHPMVRVRGVAHAAGPEAGLSGAHRPDRDPRDNPDGTRRRAAGIGASIIRPALATEYHGAGKTVNETSTSPALSRPDLDALAERSSE